MKNNTSNEYFQKMDASLQDIAMTLREIIFSVSNDFKEEIKWNVPTYSINRNVCSIMAHKHHVNLQIMRGAELPDTQWLEGTGKGMRHLKVQHSDQVNIDRVKKLLKQAIKLDQQ